MKTIFTAVCIIAVASLFAFAAGQTKIRITSPAFQDKGTIPEKFSKNGQNVSPGLGIAGAPAEAKSLGLIMDDPEPPAGPANPFTHWLVWNIDPKTTDIPEGNVPTGAIQGKNDFGE